MPGAYLPASSKAAGQCMGMPDVCKVPTPAGPVPTPFPNMGMCATATGTVPTVLIENMESIVVGSKIPSSMGDEAGVAGGVVSGVNVGPITFMTGSSKVMVKGKPLVVLTSTTAHNGSSANMPGGVVVAPSQAKVLAAL